jgi:hypothetical protein
MARSPGLLLAQTALPPYMTRLPSSCMISRLPPRCAVLVLNSTPASE